MLLQQSNHGDIALLSPQVDLKLTPDRTLFVRYPEQYSKETKRGQYKSTNRKVQKGMTRAQKELWLVRFRQRLLEHLGNPELTQRQENTGGEKDGRESQATDS